MIKPLLSLVLLLLFPWVMAQNDLLNEITTDDTYVKDPPTFKALQIVTGQSTKIAKKKEFYFVVAHRFGDISKGFDTFFGLDNATTKIGGIWGVNDFISLSISRHTYQKTYELGAKYKLLEQNESKNIPITIVGYNVVGINSELKKEVYPGLEFSDRLTYTNQLLIAKRFSDQFSLQLTPSLVHKNLIDPSSERKNAFLTGIGGRYKLSNRWSINTEYFYNFDESDVYKNPLSIGFDLETGGHVFQMMFSNAQPMTEAGYLTNAVGDWTKGEIYFGFNLYRVF